MRGLCKLQRENGEIWIRYKEKVFYGESGQPNLVVVSSIAGELEQMTFKGPLEL